MSRKRPSTFALCAFLLIVLATISACAGDKEPNGEGDFYSILMGNEFPEEVVQEPYPVMEYVEGTYPIDPIFEDFYREFGGMDILGPAISTVQTSNNIIKQYVETGLMVYDGDRALDDRFSFAPLGLDFEIADEIVTQKTIAGEQRLVRQFIYPPFLSMYEKLGGARFVGLPLTMARHNPTKNRFEQYFENLGFYQFDNGNSSEVRLMAYGAFACARDCRYQAAVGSIPSLQPILPEPFASKSAELGLQFTGRTLTEAYANQGNRREVIFENIVLIFEEGKEEVHAKPILEVLGFDPEPLKPRLNDPLMDFIPIQGDLGHNVPIYFLDYLDQHGGLALSGLPLGEVFSDQGKKFWQCFENLCLEFALSETDTAQLKPVSLGGKYKELEYEKARSFLESQSMEGIELKIWEESSFVSISENQDIYAMIYQAGSPLKNREPVLYLSMPDGEMRQSYFPPTDLEGRTMLKLAPIQAPNGTLIAYKVCLSGLKDQQKCVKDSYLMWNSE